MNRKNNFVFGEDLGAGYYKMVPATREDLIEEIEFLRGKVSLLEGNEHALVNDISELRKELDVAVSSKESDDNAPFPVYGAVGPDYTQIYKSIEPENSNDFSQLKLNLKKYPEYAWSWQCNIAMCAYDEGVSHKIANLAAARFMKLAFDIDITKHVNWAGLVQQWNEDNDEINELITVLSESLRKSHNYESKSQV